MSRKIFASELKKAVSSAYFALLSARCFIARKVADVIVNGATSAIQKPPNFLWMKLSIL